MVVAVEDPQRPVLSWARGNPSTLSDVIGADYDSAVHTGQIVSMDRNIEDAYDNRINDVFQATGQRLDNPYRVQPSNDVLDEAKQTGFGDKWRSYQQSKFASEMHRLGDQFPDQMGKIRPFDSIQDDANKLFADYDARAADVGSRTNWETRTLGGLVGGLAAGFKDPLFYATLPFYEFGAGRGVLMSMLKVGAINAGQEAAVQPFIQQWRAQAGLDSGFQQAAGNVGGAFAFGALTEGAVHGAGAGVRYLTGRGRVLPGLPVPKAASDALEAAAPHLPDDNPIKQAFEGHTGKLAEAAEPLRATMTAEQRGALDATQADRVLIDGAPDLPEEAKANAFADALRFNREGPSVPPIPEETARVLGAEPEAAEETARVLGAEPEAQPGDTPVARPAGSRLGRGLGDLMADASSDTGGVRKAIEPSSGNAPKSDDDLLAAIRSMHGEPTALGEQPIKGMINPAAFSRDPENEFFLSPELAKTAAQGRGGQEKLNQAMAAITPILKRLPKEVRVRFEDSISIKTGAGTAELNAAYSGQQRLIRLALDSESPGKYLAHESIHALRDMGLFTDKEWSTLVEHARETGIDQKYRVSEKYGDHYKQQFGDSAKDRLDEELVAHLAQDWHRGEAMPKGIAGLFERVKKLIASVRNALKGRGFATADDILGKVESGEVGSRPEGFGTSTDTPLSAGEMSPDVLAAVKDRRDPQERIKVLEQQLENRAAAAQQKLAEGVAAGSRPAILRQGGPRPTEPDLAAARAQEKRFYPDVASDPNYIKRTAEQTLQRAQQAWDDAQTIHRPQSYFDRNEDAFRSEIAGAAEQHAIGLRQVLDAHGPQAQAVVDASRDKVEVVVSSYLKGRDLSARNYLRGALDGVRNEGLVQQMSRTLQQQFGFSEVDAGVLAQQYHDRIQDAGGPTVNPDDLKKIETDMADQVARDNARRKRARVMSEKNWALTEQNLLNYRGENGERDSGRALRQLVENHTGDSMVGLFRTKEARYLGQMVRELDQFRRTAILGKRMNSARLDNVVKERFGEATGDVAAKGLAEVSARVDEAMRVEFNKWGGDIAKLDGWGMAQYHNSEAVVNAGRNGVRGFFQPSAKQRQASKAFWSNYVFQRLNRDKMLNRAGAVMGDNELRTALGKVWDNIVSNGWASREPTGQPIGSGELYMQHLDHRFLHFKDASAWLEYQKEYGVGGREGIYQALTHHVTTMSRDIAAMQKLGPNPSAQFERAKQLVQQELGKAQIGQDAAVPKRNNLGRSADLGSYARTAINRAQNMFDVFRGTAEIPVNKALAGAMRQVGHWNRATSLGTSSLSSLSDIGTQIVSRKFAGLPVTAFIKDYADHMKKENALEAAEAGLLTSASLSVYHEEARMAGALGSKSVASYLGDRALVLSGHNAIIQTGQHAFGTRFMAEMARHAGSSFDDLAKGDGLAKAYRKTFERWGIDAQGWDTIRSADIHERNDGFKMLRANEVDQLAAGKLFEQAEAIRALAERYHQMITMETDFAVPHMSVQARALLVGSTRPGTLWGEVARSASMFKGWGTTFALLHFGRMAREFGAGNAVGGAAYAAQVLFYTTLLGAMSVQLKQLVAGRDPRAMRMPSFWGAAMVQGGGFGIYGDLLLADTSSMGRGAMETLLGPTASRVEDLRRAVIGTPIREELQLESGKAAKQGAPWQRQAISLAGKNTPLGNLWYLKALYERQFLDRLQTYADPEASLAFRRRIQSLKQKTGQAYFWAPGQTTPRAPDFGAALN